MVALRNDENTMETTAQAQTVERFTIDSEERANWLLRKLANIEAEKARVQAQSAAIVKQLDGDAANLRLLYEADLEEWTRGELAKRGGRRRSLTLLQGTCKFRSVPASLKVADEAAAIAHAKAASLPFVETVEKFDKDGYRKLAIAYKEENDEDLPGVEWTPEHESFSYGKAKAGSDGE